MSIMDESSKGTGHTPAIAFGVRFDYFLTFVGSSDCTITNLSVNTRRSIVSSWAGIKCRFKVKLRAHRFQRQGGRDKTSVYALYKCTTANVNRTIVNTVSLTTESRRRYWLGKIHTQNFSVWERLFIMPLRLRIIHVFS